MPQIGLLNCDVAAFAVHILGIAMDVAMVDGELRSLHSFVIANNGIATTGRRLAGHLTILDQTIQYRRSDCHRCRLGCRCQRSGNKQFSIVTLLAMMVSGLVKIYPLRTVPSVVIVLGPV